MIRVGTVEDLSELYVMLHVMHSETANKVSPIDSEKLTAAINNVIHSGVVLIYEIDGKIAGSIALLESSDWWSNEKFVGDLWFFVYKEHRTSKAAITLAKNAMKVTKGLNVKIKMGHVYTGDHQRKDKFFKRLGLNKVGSLYTEA